MSNLSEEEKKAKLKSLIEEYEICYKESKYEGNVEEYKSLKETHKLLKDILELIDRLQKELDIKDKVIDLMAMDLQYINNEMLDYYDKLPYAENKNIEEIKEYFFEIEKLENEE